MLDINFPINNVTFVGTKDKYGYQQVLDDLMKAEKVRILTYSNISEPFLDKLRDLDENVDIKIIVSAAGLWTNNNAYDSKKLEEKLDEMRGVFEFNKYKSNVTLHFCYKNHAKMIGTGNVLYVGSENYSVASRYNYEAGFLIKDSDNIEKIYKEYLDKIETVELKCTKTDKLRMYIQIFYESVVGLSIIPDIYEVDEWIKFEEERVNARNALKSMMSYFKNLDIKDPLQDELRSELEDSLLAIEEAFDEIDQKIADIFDKCRSRNGYIYYDYLYEYFEDVHREEVGLQLGQEWIDEDTPYVPLIDDPDKDSLVEKYWYSEIYSMPVEEEYISLLNQNEATILSSKGNILDALNDYDSNASEAFEAEVIEKGTDPEVYK